MPCHKSRLYDSKYTLRTQENIDAVGDLVLSQKDAPGTHHTVRHIAKETGIHRSSVLRIISDDLQLVFQEKARSTADRGESDNSP